MLVSGHSITRCCVGWLPFGPPGSGFLEVLRLKNPVGTGSLFRGSITYNIQGGECVLLAGRLVVAAA